LPQTSTKSSICCSIQAQPEIQSITTIAADVNEVQYPVLDSSYQGNISAASFVRRHGWHIRLVLDGETVYISHDYDANQIKEAIELLSLVDQVSISINNGGSTACAQHDGVNAGDISITFLSLFGIAGNLPLTNVETSGLDGAMWVEVHTVTDGDSALNGSLKLSFRGATTEFIDVSADVNN
jgi:hypothetical protein